MAKDESSSPRADRRSPSLSRPKRSRSRSPSLTKPKRSRSRSPLLSKPKRSRSRSCDSEDASNPGNNLYVTGLSSRVNESDLKEHFNREGKVLECHLVKDPHSKESRGFAFVTMESKKDAEQCVKHLNRSVLEGRLITVEKAKRSRGRTPTPGRYQGLRDTRESGRSRRRSRSHSPRRRPDRNSDHRDHRHGRLPSPRGRRGDDRDSGRRAVDHGSGRRADDHDSRRRHRDRS